MGRGSEANPQPLSLESLRGNLGAILGMILAGGLLTWMLITDGVRDVAYALSFNLMPLYLEDIGGLSAQQIGWLMSIFGLANMATSIPAGWLADKRGERVAIVLGFVLQAAAMFGFVRVQTFLGYAIVWALFGVGVACMGPAYESLISKAVPDELRGTAFGLLRSSLGLFSLPAPAIGAQLWERISPRFPFRLTAGAALLAIVPVWFKFKLPKERPDDGP
ncbi:MAG: MFS transporter [Chloroflexia bacterium]|nr:MFS transporter [Chloroflexia bacterium]